MKRMMKCLFAVAILFAQSGFAAQADLLPLAERKKLFAAGGARPAAVPLATRKWEFSNQSNQMAAAWVWLGHRCWIPYTLTPERDSGIVNPTEEGGTTYIYTSAGFFLLIKQYQTLRLSKEVATGPGRSEARAIREMPWNEATDILIIVSPDGSVDFVKRNR